MGTKRPRALGRKRVHFSRRQQDLIVTALRAAGAMVQKDVQDEAVQLADEVEQADYLTAVTTHDL